MRARSLLILTPLLLSLSFACSDDEGTTTAGGGGGPTSDADGDGISDADEGAADNVDTDGDGTPDYLDLDSDDDGIPDAVEAGDSDLATPPVDSDGDGTPDFRDTDSDDNGILDAVEGEVDTDGDGKGDYADFDNDGDGASDVDEILGANADCDGDGVADPEGTPDAPADCDGDGTPNFMDTDSDDDLILDQHESSNIDTDNDGFLDRYDLDSDNDGWLDIDEAGDAVLATPPVDTDGDLVPDFRDLDSDNDGLSDADELLYGTDPTNQDSDGDGVSDLVEVAAGTDPLDPMDNPQAYGDFVFIVPYQQQTTPPDDTLEFRTSIQIADIYFLLDETGSMSQEFSTLNNAVNGVPAIIDALKCQDFGTACNIDNDCAAGQVCASTTSTCIEDPLTANSGAGCLVDLWTGVGHFNNCNTYRNTQFLQPDAATTATAVGTTGPGSAEAVLQSPACVADPTLCSNGNINCGAHASVTNPVGCAGFRPEAVRLLLHGTDAGDQAPNTCGVPHDASFPGNALQAAGIEYVGLPGSSDNGGDPCANATTCLTQIGIAAGTVDSLGNPFLSPAVDTGGAAFRDGIINVVLEVARNKPLYVTIDAVDEPGDAGDALQFLDYLEVNISGTGNCTTVTPTGDENADGRDDSFPSLLGGTPVCWDVYPVQSQSTTPATDQVQLFKAKLTVYGDGSPLDARDVYFLVPPAGITVPPPPQ